MSLLESALDFVTTLAARALKLKRVLRQRQGGEVRFNADQPVPWRALYVQRPLAWLLRRIAPKSRLWYDVATFSLRGHQCANCGRLSRTEHVHITHECGS